MSDEGEVGQALYLKGVEIAQRIVTLAFQCGEDGAEERMIPQMAQQHEELSEVLLALARIDDSKFQAASLPLWSLLRLLTAYTSPTSPLTTSSRLHAFLLLCCTSLMPCLRSGRCFSKSRSVIGATDMGVSPSQRKKLSLAEALDPQELDVARSINASIPKGTEQYSLHAMYVAAYEFVESAEKMELALKNDEHNFLSQLKTHASGLCDVFQRSIAVNCAATVDSIRDKRAVMRFYYTSKVSQSTKMPTDECCEPPSCGRLLSLRGLHEAAGSMLIVLHFHSPHNTKALEKAMKGFEARSFGVESKAPDGKTARCSTPTAFYPVFFQHLIQFLALESSQKPMGSESTLWGMYTHYGLEKSFLSRQPLVDSQPTSFGAIFAGLVNDGKLFVSDDAAPGTAEWLTASHDVQLSSAQYVKELLAERVPQELQFSDGDSASSLRDVDEVIRLLRHMSEVPMVQSSEGPLPADGRALSAQFFHELYLRRRKRSSDDGTMRMRKRNRESQYETRCVLPASQEPVSALLATQATPPTVLERIYTQHCK